MKKTDFLYLAMGTCLVGAVGAISWPGGSVLLLVLGMVLSGLGWVFAGMLSRMQKSQCGGAKNDTR